ncbi:hypothetical protein [Vandammella animalimorsus]|uniref:hypothetical protein n=1 Tax=Vandammella animalimorsus TaxID=2029117 RepID=UPI001EED646E|nr:hypothetical protein [Vandammella animalimorsus]
MAIQSPLSFLSNIASSIGKSITLPAWLIEEMQRRMVLLLNHMLQQEPQAQQRLAKQQGKTIYLSWRQFNGQVRITPAGLLDLDSTQQSSDLLVEVAEPSISQLARHAAQGERPPIRIAGDVALASELNWVIDNVRWDVEDDLARLIGDVPAHKLAQLGRIVADALRKFAQGALATWDGLSGSGRAGTGAAPAPTAAQGRHAADYPVAVVRTAPASDAPAPAAAAPNSPDSPDTPTQAPQA